jgi:hypothetical protein
MCIFPLVTAAQTHNYWTRSFNEESSLLSGAVVGGGSGASAIYYNPANISEVKAASLSVNASLFSFDFITLKNALGDGIDLSSSRASVEPRFLSYMIKRKKRPAWSFELAFLNNENTRVELIQSVDERIDILSQAPGEERYFAVYRYFNQFRDDWICFGSSVRISDRLYAGVGVYVIIKSLQYTNSLDIEAYSPSGDFDRTTDFTGTAAVNQRYQFLKFNDYRINTKLGLTYKYGRYSIGVCLTSPSVGGIYSDGKRVTHKQSQANIYDPVTGEPVPNFTIIDYKQKDDMDVSFKTPFSISAGLSYRTANGKRTFYTSAEYFHGLDPYRVVEAEESPDIASGEGFDERVYEEWLTFVAGARPVFNVSVGYSWTLKEDLLLMAGFRTDFNYQKNMDFGDFEDFQKIENLDLDLYYITCGLSWNVLGQDIITGLQYSVGRTTGEKQIANLAEPVEYSPVEHIALQGDPKSNMTTLLNAISLYFGASFNWGEEKK